MLHSFSAILSVALVALSAAQARADSVADFESDRVSDGIDFDAARAPFQDAVGALRIQRVNCVTGESLGAALPYGIIPSDLSKFDEKTALGGSSQPRLFALTDRYGMVRTEKPPLVLIHGLFGSPADLQAVADHFMKSGRFQVYVLAYHEAARPIDDNGEDIAVLLRALKQQSSGARREGVRIIAHSLGGLVGRATLNALTADNASSGRRFGPVHLIAVDSPWHGFPGPSDRGIDQLPSGMAGVFLPAALMDMRARSDFFQGNPDSPDPVRKRGVLRARPDEDMKIDIIFAQEGTEALDYTEGQLSALPALLVQHYNGIDNGLHGVDPRLWNFWYALIDSTQFYAFDLELETLSNQGKLTEPLALATLKKYFPRYPGNHMTVLQEHPGQVSALDALEKLTQN